MTSCFGFSCECGGEGANASCFPTPGEFSIPGVLNQKIQKRVGGGVGWWRWGRGVASKNLDPVRSREKERKGEWIHGLAGTWTFKREASPSEMCGSPRPPGPNGFVLPQCSGE